LAASDLARGQPLSTHPVPDEIIWFLLAKEFGWLPSEIKREDAKDIKGITHVLSNYNTTRNTEMERMNKQSKAGHGRRGMSGGGSGKYIRKERVGPQGVSVEEIPM